MADTLEDHEEPKDLKDIFFDPECRPSTRKGKEACAQILLLYLEAEDRHAPRLRNRKSKDLEILKAQLSAVLGNMVASTVRIKPTGIAITQSNSILGKKDSHPILNDTLRQVLQLLEGELLICRTVGDVLKRKQTTITPGKRGLQLISEFNLSRGDFKHKDRQPLVLRSRKTIDEKRKGKSGKELPLPKGPHVDFMQAQVVRFNEYLSKQQIFYLGNRDDIDDERKTTHRVFNNGSLCEGGRLYGGFWHSLSGAKDGLPDERCDIEINGELLTGLDYGQIAVRILYSFEGVDVPLEDAYLLPGWERSREGIKKLINTLINDPSCEAKAIRKLFKDRSGLNVERLTSEALASIYEHHSTIKHHFAGKSTGKIFFEESNHLMRVLMALVDMNIPALPVHDCLYVRDSDVPTVRPLMKSMFEEHFKVSINVNDS